MAARTNNRDSSARRLPAGPVFLILLSVLCGAVVFSAGSGYLRIPYWTVIMIIAAGMTGLEGIAAHVGEFSKVVVMDVRLPRILSSVFVGAGLAVSGAVFQEILLNPLADPYTLGISAGAAFGASLALLTGFAAIGVYTVPAFAFLGALLILAAVIYLSAGGKDMSSGSLILSGVIVALKKRVYFEAIHERMRTFSPSSMAVFALEAAGGISAATGADPRGGTDIADFGKERILSLAETIDVYLAQSGPMNRVTVAQIKSEPGFNLIKAVRENRVYLVDEEIVSRPTPRLAEGIFFIGRILYPDVFTGKAKPWSRERR